MKSRLISRINVLAVIVGVLAAGIILARPETMQGLLQQVEAADTAHAEAEAAHAEAAEDPHGAAAPVDACCEEEAGLAVKTGAAASAAPAVDACCAEEDAAAIKAENQAPAVKLAAAALAVDECCATEAGAAAGEAEHLSAAQSAHEDHEAHDNLGGAWCGEHNVAEAECAICQPARTAVLTPGDGLKIRLARAGALEEAGVEVGPAQAGSTATANVVHLARVTYDQTRFAHVTPRTAGVIEEVLVALGQQVEKGTPLASLSSPDVAQARSDLKRAQAQEALAREVFAREKMLWEKEVTSTQEYREAEAELEQAVIETQLAREQLTNAGVEPGAGADAASVVTVRSPLAGTVVEWHAVVGENAERGESLFTIADLSTMWLELSIPATSTDAVRVGDTLQARMEGLEGVVLEATVDWIDSRVDPQSRTVNARAVVPNPGGMLKDGMLARVTLEAGGEGGALEVPTSAVQEYEGKPYVFVKHEDDLFEIRQVALGGRKGERVAVVAGLGPEEEIVLARSFTAKSEFLKSRLGAGCADH